jgi:hypothetical protein
MPFCGTPSADLGYKKMLCQIIQDAQLMEYLVADISTF